MKGKSTTFEQFGVASVLPGLTYAIELLTEQRDTLLQHLKQLQEPQSVTPTKTLLLSNTRRKASPYWEAMSPEERSAEMIRRRKVTHKAIAEKIDYKKVAKKNAAKYAALPEKVKQERIAKMLASRAASQAAKKQQLNGASAAQA